MLTCCARMSKDRSTKSQLKTSASSHHLPNMEHMAAYGPWRVEWWGEEMCGIRACVAAEGFERASGVAGECVGIERGGEGSRRARYTLPTRALGAHKFAHGNLGMRRWIMVERALEAGLGRAHRVRSWTAGSGSGRR